MHALTWIGIAFCISQSAMFSGLNLALFSVSRLRLEIEATQGNARASRLLALRKDTNFLLTTILWGNVGINVLLTMLSDSVLAGVAAFLFSTALITFAGEIAPQAYFSRHALQMASALAPVLRIYQVLLYAVAKPTALLLDRWLGAEAIPYFQEKDLHELIDMHIKSPSTDIDAAEGMGARNFLDIDDVPLSEEGEAIDPESIVTLPFTGRRPDFPPIEPLIEDPFLQLLQASGKKWVVVLDENDSPEIVIDSDGFLRAALFTPGLFNPYVYCHHPIVIRDADRSLGEAITRLKVYATHPGDDVVDEDIIIVWGDARRVITGADILGRLLRGIAKRQRACLLPLDREDGSHRKTE